jgi:hypothetical protein
MATGASFLSGRSVKLTANLHTELKSRILELYYLHNPRVLMQGIQSFKQSDNLPSFRHDTLKRTILIHMGIHIIPVMTGRGDHTNSERVREITAKNET